MNIKFIRYSHSQCEIVNVKKKRDQNWFDQKREFGIEIETKRKMCINKNKKLNIENEGDHGKCESKNVCFVEFLFFVFIFFSICSYRERIDCYAKGISMLFLEKQKKKKCVERRRKTMCQRR